MQLAIGTGLKTPYDIDESTSDGSITNDGLLRIPYEDIKSVSCICIPSIKVQKIVGRV